MTTTTNNIPKTMDVWVLAGQSNMQGCGLLADESLPSSNEDERVWNFSSRGGWEVANEPLHRLWESCTPVHLNFLRRSLAEADKQLSNKEIAAREASTRFTGAGLGIAFGQALSQATRKEIGLISAAHGGTTLDQWSHRLKSEGGHSLYGAMLERIERAREFADFNLKGVLWYQGESDAVPGVASTYGQRFDEWVEALRSDLVEPELPILTVQIGAVVRPLSTPPQDGWQASAWDEIREAQRTMPSRSQHTAVTSAIDLGLCDGIHIDTPGLMRLGKRMARQAQDLSAGPRLQKIERNFDHPHGFTVLRVHCDGVLSGWQPRQHIAGFSLHEESGQVHRDFGIIAANADQRDPKIINVITTATQNSPVSLGYGIGLKPYCNAVDEADMPLLAFAPQAF